MTKKSFLTLSAVLVFAAAASAIDIVVIQGTDVVDYEVLNSNYAALKQAGEDCQDATNALNSAIADLPIDDLIEIAQAHQQAIAQLNAATNQHQIAIVALKGASNAHQQAIAALVSASNAHQVAIAQLNTATQVQGVAIAALEISTNNLPPPGTIVMYVATNAPPGWRVCDGSGCHTSIYSRLHAVIKYSFGGSGTNFFLPNLQSRVPVGLAPSGTFNGLSKIGGAENVTLSIAQMPSHRHLINAIHNGLPGAATLLAGKEGVLHENWIGTDYVGGGQSHENMPPYLVINYIIKF